MRRWRGDLLALANAARSADDPSHATGALLGLPRRCTTRSALWGFIRRLTGGRLRLAVMEQEKIRRDLARTIEETTRVASKLG